jgi:hypothetical protein
MTKKIIGLLLPAVMMGAIATAQNAPTSMDASPMDMSYSPAGYPGLMIQKKVSGGPNARIIYSRPQLKGRRMLGDREKWGSVWRMGANESTELELYKDATIGGKKLSKGRYTLYALIDSLNWKVIVNKGTDSWGAYTYDSTKDVVRIPVPVQPVETPTENLTIYFDNSNNLVMMWEKAKVVLPVTFTNAAVVNNTPPKPAASGTN